MDKKLTLSLNQRILEKAKKYAKDNKTSLSEMIESYLDSLTRDKEDSDSDKITSLVVSLCGVIELPDNFDYKISLRDSNAFLLHLFFTIS
jgi:hypothetical protein